CRDGLFEARNAGSNDLLAPQIHEWNAGVALHVRGDAADFTGTGDDVAGIVAAQIKTGFFKLRVVDALDPLPAPSRPALIDKKLIVVLDQEFRGVARLLVGIAEQLAGDHEIAREQRRSAFSHEAFADDQRFD